MAPKAPESGAKAGGIDQCIGKKMRRENAHEGARAWLVKSRTHGEDGHARRVRLAVTRGSAVLRRGTRSSSCAVGSSRPKPRRELRARDKSGR